jgi:hypothetical protein
LQDASFVVTVAMLIIVIRRVRSGRGTWLMWSPFIVAAVLTLAFYVLVFIDSNIADVFVATAWSAVLRLSVQIALLLFAYYAPHCGGGKP